MMALNAETENANRNVKLGSDDGFERRNCETMMAPNTELRMMKALNAVIEKMVAPNAETEK